MALIERRVLNKRTYLMGAVAGAGILLINSLFPNPYQEIDDLHSKTDRLIVDIEKSISLNDRLLPPLPLNRNSLEANLDKAKSPEANLDKAYSIKWEIESSPEYAQYANVELQKSFIDIGGILLLIASLSKGLFRKRD